MNAWRTVPFQVLCRRFRGDPLAPHSEFMTVEMRANRYLERPLFARAASHAAYMGEPRELIHLLKYHQVRPALGALVRMLAHAAQPLLRASIAAGFCHPAPLYAG